jgi:hypothetical protein
MKYAKCRKAAVGERTSNPIEELAVGETTLDNLGPCLCQKKPETKTPVIHNAL